MVPGTVPGMTILKLCKNLYGLKDVGCTWHEHLHNGLLKHGFKRSLVDLCLFTKGSILIIM